MGVSESVAKGIKEVNELAENAKKNANYKKAIVLPPYDEEKGVLDLKKKDEHMKAEIRREMESPVPSDGSLLSRQARRQIERDANKKKQQFMTVYQAEGFCKEMFIGLITSSLTQINMTYTAEIVKALSNIQIIQQNHDLLMEDYVTTCENQQEVIRIIKEMYTAVDNKIFEIDGALKSLDERLNKIEAMLFVNDKSPKVAPAVKETSCKKEEGVTTLHVYKCSNVISGHSYKNSFADVAKALSRQKEYVFTDVFRDVTGEQNVEYLGTVNVVCKNTAGRIVIPRTLVRDLNKLLVAPVAEQKEKMNAYEFDSVAYAIRYVMLRKPSFHVRKDNVIATTATIEPSDYVNLGVVRVGNAYVDTKASTARMIATMDYSLGTKL